jgi:hypothetical protein
VLALSVKKEDEKWIGILLSLKHLASSQVMATTDEIDVKTGLVTELVLDSIAVAAGYDLDTLYAKWRKKVDSDDE